MQEDYSNVAEKPIMENKIEMLERPSSVSEK